MIQRNYFFVRLPVLCLAGQGIAEADEEEGVWQALLRIAGE
ncbi:MAG: hypothetical protein ABFC84_18715 [Veillonellales bacterium]